MDDVNIRGIATRRNPDEADQNEVVDVMFDDLGRQVMTPYQVRDLITTANATLSSGTETVVLSGDSSNFHDLMEVSMSNTSDAAMSISLRDGGTDVRTLYVPASDTVQFQFPVPLPQGTQGSDWLVDMDDVTGTTIYVGAIFIKND